MNKDNIQKNIKIVYYDYNIGDKVVLNNNDALKYATPYIDSFDITQRWTNDMVTLK